MTPSVPEHGIQCMSWSAIFSIALKTEILSAEASDFFTQIIILKSFDSMLYSAYQHTYSRYHHI